MVSLRHIVLAFCGLALVSAPLRAAVLIHEYALRGSLADNLGGPSLSAFSGKIEELGYVFAANEGLQFTSASFPATSFSLEFSFKLDSTAGYVKLVDFKQHTVDSGLYQRDGALAFYPVATGPTSEITAGANVHVVLTRDGTTNRVTGYVNGQQRFSFIDSSMLTEAQNGTLHFFADDGITRNEGAAGTANYLRVFDGPLTASEVSALFAAGPPLAIPEPSTAVLLALGGLGFAAWTARRRKRV